MKILVANDGECFINAAYIVGAHIECGCTVKIENEKAVPYKSYSIMVYTQNDADGEYIIAKDIMTEAEAKAKLKKIGNYLCTDASFLIDFNEE